MNVRDWLYVEDRCRAVDLVVRKGALGQIYLVGARTERRNLDIARLVCRLVADALGPPAERYLEAIELVGDRPGHDFPMPSIRADSSATWRGSRGRASRPGSRKRSSGISRTSGPLRLIRDRP